MAAKLVASDASSRLSVARATAVNTFSTHCSTFANAHAVVASARLLNRHSRCCAAHASVANRLSSTQLTVANAHDVSTRFCLFLLSTCFLSVPETHYLAIAPRRCWAARPRAVNNFTSHNTTFAHDHAMLASACVEDSSSRRSADRARAANSCLSACCNVANAHMVLARLCGWKA
eukprot:gnl/TRDRNA2_/TRDRNA2_173697_c5_seq11.p1 gnl/TRDRNA2_/TRDRNA2_173697_c5~~gnl/TRDRNA2_/TRDRNA2_173697_c5_seq11.p1  ORF type:complete len:175 (-),score=7.77 gnl/TRDRNA2_/TRDRNA2_173697_c5_seq11:512-1036(-)